MRNEFTAIIEGPTDDDLFWIAYCVEVPGANGQGETEAEALESLQSAILLMLEVRREEGLRGIPDTARRTVVSVG